LTPETLTDVAGIRAELATIREQLFAVASNHMVLGATAIAAPVFNAQGKVLATIALVWFTPELAPRAKVLGPQVRDIGLDLSAELGVRVPPLQYRAQREGAGAPDRISDGAVARS